MVLCFTCLQCCIATTTTNAVLLWLDLAFPCWFAGMYSLGPKPALIREPAHSDKGAQIELEVWELPIEKVG